MGKFDLSQVVELTPNDFNGTELQIQGCALVLVYTPWCTYCQDMEEVWKKLATCVSFGEICAFNADAHEQFYTYLQTELGVEGYPTILSYNNGKYIEEYTGKRTSKELYDHAMKVCRSGRYRV